MLVDVFFIKPSGKRCYYKLDVEDAIKLESQGALLQLTPTRYMKIFINRTDLKEFVLYRDKYVCYVCGGIATDIEKIVTKELGGTVAPANFRSICTNCNKITLPQTKHLSPSLCASPSSEIDVRWLDKLSYLPTGNKIYCDASYDPTTNLLGICAVIADPVPMAYVQIVSRGRNSYHGEIEALKMGLKLANFGATVHTDIAHFRLGEMGKIIKSMPHASVKFHNDKQNKFYHAAHVYSRWAIKEIKKANQH